MEKTGHEPSGLMRRQLLEEQLPERAGQLRTLYGQQGIIPLIPDAADPSLPLTLASLQVWTAQTLGVWSYATISNPHSVAIDMSGWRLTGAALLACPPTIVSSTTAFGLMTAENHCRWTQL